MRRNLVRAEQEAKGLINKLQTEVEALTPADKLRFAADLLDHGKPTKASRIAKLACKELDVAIAVGRLRDWVDQQ